MAKALSWITYVLAGQAFRESARDKIWGRMRHGADAVQLTGFLGGNRGSQGPAASTWHLQPDARGSRSPAPPPHLSTCGPGHYLHPNQPALQRGTRGRNLGAILKFPPTLFFKFYFKSPN